jgi:hypothetical protein
MLDRRYLHYEIYLLDRRYLHNRTFMPDLGLEVSDGCYLPHMRNYHPVI